MRVNYKALLEHYQREPLAADRCLKRAMKEKVYKPADFELGSLFVECFGWHEFQSCRKKDRLARDVMEASGAVASQFFQNISGQIVFSALMESFDAPEFVFSRMIPSVPTQFDGEKIAGISAIGDEALVVGENDPYPLAGVVEDWIETPRTRKRGLIVPVTREAIFFDRTGVLLDRCRQVGYWLGYNKEVRAIDCVIDENAGAVSAMLGGHRFHWKGNSMATYGNNSGTHTFDNLQATNTLVDYTDIENAELLLDAMSDPENGIITGVYRAAAKHLVVTTQNLHTAKQIITATDLVLHAGGYALTGNLPERHSPNSLQSYEIVTSPLLAGRQAIDTSWFLGNIMKAFRYMENWPLQTREAPSNSHDEFHRDIVQQFRADERGAYATFDPRYMIASTVA